MRYINCPIILPTGAGLSKSAPIVITAWLDSHNDPTHPDDWLLTGFMYDDDYMKLIIPQDIPPDSGLNYKVDGVLGCAIYQDRALTPPANDGANIQLMNPETKTPYAIQLQAGTNSFRRGGLNPDTLTLDQILKFRGAMWSARWSGRYGPRPGTPTNILAMDYYEWYSSAERAEMLEIYKGQHPQYTHAVTGPMIDMYGYHGQYPTYPGPLTQSWWDAYLDCLEQWYAKGIIPVHFIHPDGWDFDTTRRVLEPFYLQPRAQRLLRCVVPSGWEPAGYEWSSKTWGLYGAWARQILPNAAVGIHTQADKDAPAGVDALWNDNTNPNGNADAWAHVAPNVHFWLIQNGAYYVPPAGDPTTARNFALQFDSGPQGTAAHSIAAHLRNGYAGWPTTSANGNAPIRIINGECTAYASYWRDLPEPDSQDYGDLAMANGADGYLDGGRG